MSRVITFVRHGETRMNQEGIIIGTIDDYLSDEGYRQSERAGATLFHSRVPYDVVFSSPLQRARRTAEIIGGMCAVHTVTIDDRLMERNVGEYQGQKEFPERARLFLDEIPSPMAEPLEAFRSRVLAALQAVVDTKKNVILVTHMLPLMVMLGEIRGLSVEELLTSKMPKNCEPISFLIDEPCGACGRVFYTMPQSE